MTIESIRLKGAGIEKVLRPTTGENVHGNDAFLSSTDFCKKNCFNFFGLPAGKYDIKITAKGFKPSLKTYVVEPGIPPTVRDTELLPLE